MNVEQLDEHKLSRTEKQKEITILWKSPSMFGAKWVPIKDPPHPPLPGWSVSDFKFFSKAWLLRPLVLESARRISGEIKTLDCNIVQKTRQNKYYFKKHKII